MRLLQTQKELLKIFENEIVGVSPQGLNLVGEVKQDTYKIAIINGENENDNRCRINFLVGISVDSYDELLLTITHVVKIFKGKKLSTSSSKDSINLSEDKAFEIFTPESGKWIANLSFFVRILYDFSDNDDPAEYIFSEQYQIENINYADD